MKRLIKYDLVVRSDCYYPDVVNAYLEGCITLGEYDELIELKKAGYPYGVALQCGEIKE